MKHFCRYSEKERIAMISRQITSQFKQLAQEFPVVTLLGPRQSGKTTLARLAFPQHEYVNLEMPDIRAAAQADPVGFFKTRKGPLILDEIQRVPELLCYIQGLVDERKRKGEFILTGSHQPRLAESISQSLAGRTGILRLLPLSIEDLAKSGISLERDELVLAGFMPSVHADGITPRNFYRSYFQTYVERDARMLINISSFNAFETFVKLLAGRAGQVVNLHSLAGDVGVSSTTLASWLAVLEASFIVFRLPCYFNNFGKRLIKSPKVYFTEVGFAAWLLGIETAEQVSRDPLFGGLFENLVVAEALKARLNAGEEAELYYFRDQRGLEVDLILNRARQILPIEIKAGMTYDASFTKNLETFCALAPAAVLPVVIYGGERQEETRGVRFRSFRETGKIIRETPSA
jgi:predicted AAA+ superfamily ATPase